MSNEYGDWVKDRLQDLERAEALLTRLLQRAYMRLDYHEADEIAEFLGVKKPTDHEMEDLR